MGEQGGEGCAGVFGGARLSRHRVCRVSRGSQIRFVSSAVHSPSSRAVVARGKVNFFFFVVSETSNRVLAR